MSNAPFTVFSDYKNVLTDFQEHILDLYYLKELIGSNYFSLEADGTLQIMHYVGFFQKGNTSIQILPKIYAKSDTWVYEKEELNTSLDFLYRLLYWSGYLSHKRLPPQLSSKSETQLLELFISIFIDEFIDLFSRKINHEYVQVEENQQFIKGKILFSETTRRNPITRHMHYVRYDEYSINNPLNRLFKSLMVELLNRTTSSNNKKQLVLGLAYLQEVDLIRLNSDKFKQIKFNRLNLDYEPLFNLAKLFYHNAQPGISEGSEKTFSFLVPVHLLFENFVAKLLEGFSNAEYKYCYHEPGLWFGKQIQNDVFELKPDFIVKQGEQVVIVADTKFKYPFNDKGKVAISESDLYQLITYSVKCACNNLILIYPKFMDCPNEESLLTEYKLSSPYGKISLKIIQIDIMETDLEKISDELMIHLDPRNTDQDSGTISM